MKWEYMRVRFVMGWRMVAGGLEEGIGMKDEILNQYGRDGWEIISVVPDSDDKGSIHYIALMKRPLNSN